MVARAAPRGRLAGKLSLLIAQSVGASFKKATSKKPSKPARRWTWRGSAFLWFDDMATQTALGDLRALCYVRTLRFITLRVAPTGGRDAAGSGLA
jgi:hypothetical protein